MSITPFKFQETSVSKLTMAAKRGYTSGLIADDMGLGKTVQGILLDKRKRELYADTYQGRMVTIVVAPLSVLDVWERHLRLCHPELKVYTVDPKARHVFARHIRNAAKGNSEYDVFICHWDAIRHPDLTGDLQRVKWFHVIADEVHRAKNRKAQQTVALKKMRTKHKLGLSGTPADDKPDDFYSILNWLYPSVFTSYWRFFNYHCIVVHHDESGTSCGCLKEKGHGHKRPYREVVGTANVDELKEQIAPYYVRRLKEDVLKELPGKYYTTIQVDLTQQQRRAYNEMRKSMLAWVGTQEDQPVAAPVVVSQLTRLQQFACAYGQLETVIKRRRDVRDCEDSRCKRAGKCQGHKMEVLRLTDPSSKLDAVMQLVEDNPGKQLVVFGQSKQTINLLAERLRKKNITVGVLTGDTPQSERGKLVEDFQSGKLQMFVGTIKAGGEGITLTAASTMVFLDRAWSPSKNRQAEDRLHRIGQENAVQVIDIVARDTVDLGRLQKIKLKWSWIKAILGDDITTVQDQFLSGIDELITETENA